MAQFEQCIETILRHEGLLEDDKSDSGGLTKYGISLAYLLELPKAEGDVNKDGKIDSQDVRSLTLPQAKELYKIGWWDKYGYQDIQDSRIATKILDMAVNLGGSQAHKLAQRALGLDADGILGEETKAKLNSTAPDDLLPKLADEAMQFYVHLTFSRIQKMGIEEGGKFLMGWIRRAYDEVN